MDEKGTKQYCMLMHLSQLLNFVIPIAGLLVPIVMWSMKKEESPLIDGNGKAIINFQLSLLVYCLVSMVLMIIIIGFVMLLALAVASIIFVIIAAVRANEGEVYKYPYTIQFLKTVKAE